MRYPLGIAVMIVVVVAGCGKKVPADRITYVADDDPRMNAAIEKARSTVNTFIAALRAPKPGQSAFLIKLAFLDGSNSEQMWLSLVSYRGKKLHGTISNEPGRIKTVKMGQSVSVDPSEISDWMFTENKKLVGGFTIRVLHDVMSASERVEFDKTTPFEID